jgi:predicted nucleic acid-binding protein
MIRVVLDTNIIVPALLQPLGFPAQVLSMVLDGPIQMSVSVVSMPSTRKSSAARG